MRTEVLNDAIIQVFDRKLLESRQGQGHSSNEPIFIIGLPRSGSTLLEQILASHSQVEGTAELPYVSVVSNSISNNRADGLSYPQAMRELGRQTICAGWARTTWTWRVSTAPRAGRASSTRCPTTFPPSASCS